MRNALYLAETTARPFLEACHNDREDPHPLLTDLWRFKDDLWWLGVLCNEGWRLLGKYERPLVSAAGGAVRACGIVGTNAHETALRLADRVIGKIAGGIEGGISFSRRLERTPLSFLEKHLRGLKTTQFKKEVEEIPKRTDFFDQEQLCALEEQVRSEYLIASSQPKAEIPQPPGGESSDAERTADSKTDKKRKVKAVTPENPDVAKLAKKIKKELPKGGTMIDVARDSANGNEIKAQSLLRQLRSDRYRNLLG